MQLASACLSIAWGVAALSYLAGLCLQQLPSRYYRHLGQGLRDGAILSSIFLTIFTGYNLLYLAGLGWTVDAWGHVPSEMWGASEVVGGWYSSASAMAWLAVLGLLAGAIALHFMPGGVVVARLLGTLSALIASALGAVVAGLGGLHLALYALASLTEALKLTLPALIAVAPALIAFERTRRLGLTLFAFSLAFTAAVPIAYGFVSAGLGRAKGLEADLEEAYRRVNETVAPMALRAPVNVTVEGWEAGPIVAIDDGSSKPYAFKPAPSNLMLLPPGRWRAQLIHAGYVLDEGELTVREEDCLRPEELLNSSRPPPKAILELRPRLILLNYGLAAPEGEGYVWCGPSRWPVGPVRRVGANAVERWGRVPEGVWVVLHVASLGEPKVHVEVSHPNATGQYQVLPWRPSFKLEEVELAYRFDNGTVVKAQVPKARWYEVRGSWAWRANSTPPRALDVVVRVEVKPYALALSLPTRELEVAEKLNATVGWLSQAYQARASGVVEGLMRALLALASAAIIAPFASSLMGGYGLSVGPIALMGRRVLSLPARSLRFERPPRLGGEMEELRRAVKRAEEMKARGEWVEPSRAAKLTARLSTLGLSALGAGSRLSYRLKLNRLRSELARAKDAARLAELELLRLRAERLAREGYLAAALQEMHYERASRLSGLAAGLHGSPRELLASAWSGLRWAARRLWAHGEPYRARLMEAAKAALIGAPYLSARRLHVEADVLARYYGAVAELGDLVHRYAPSYHATFERLLGGHFEHTPTGMAWRALESLTPHLEPRVQEALAAALSAPPEPPATCMVRERPRHLVEAHHELYEAFTQANAERGLAIYARPCDLIPALEAAYMHSEEVELKYVGYKAWRYEDGSLASRPTFIVVVRGAKEAKGGDALDRAGGFFASL